MPPIRSKPLREADVWLDETLWADEPAPRRGRARTDDPDPGGFAAATGFFDHEREPEPDEILASRGRHGSAERVELDWAESDPDDERSGGELGTQPLGDRDADAALAPDGPVPGLLRRPLVEVQRSLPVERRRTPKGPDRIAMWAVALAVLTLVSAIISAHA